MITDADQSKEQTNSFSRKAAKGTKIEPRKPSFDVRRSMLEVQRFAAFLRDLCAFRGEAALAFARAGFARATFALVFPRTGLVGAAPAGTSNPVFKFTDTVSKTDTVPLPAGELKVEV